MSGSPIKPGPGKTVRLFPEGEGAPAPPAPSRDSESTVVGSAPLGWEPAITEGEEPSAPSSPRAVHTPRTPHTVPPQSDRPPIEVEVRYIKNLATHARRPPPAYEIWTKNRVYNLDISLTCTEVIDLSTGATDDRHQLIGAQLVGGQRRSDDGNELSYPLPTPGTDAVFQKPDPKGRVRLIMTSKVTRVLLHVQCVKVIPENAEHTWDQITNSRSWVRNP